MAMHCELGWFNIQLFGDVFTDLYQILSTLTAGTYLKVMEMLNAREMVWKWLTTRPFSGLSGLFLFRV
jgi:hypothetical protein